MDAEKISRKLLRGAATNEKTIRTVAISLSVVAGLLFAYALFSLGNLDSALIAANNIPAPS